MRQPGDAHGLGVGFGERGLVADRQRAGHGAGSLRLKAGNALADRCTQSIYPEPETFAQRALARRLDDTRGTEGEAGRAHLLKERLATKVESAWRHRRRWRLQMRQHIDPIAEIQGLAVLENLHLN